VAGDDLLGSSTKTGLQKPNCAMLFAICRICFFECVRALFGCGRSSRTDVVSIFISVIFLEKLAYPEDNE
jgi:hypothetical protein